MSRAEDVELYHYIAHKIGWTGKLKAEMLQDAVDLLKIDAGEVAEKTG